MRVAVFALILTLPMAAQIPGGRIPDRVKPQGDAKAAPRLANGKPDLGNGKGVWNPVTIANIAGVGRQGPARSPVEKVVDVKFLDWARKYYDEAQANLAKDDPEARCLPPGIPRMYATPFPFQIFQLDDRVIFLFEGGTHIFRTVPLASSRDAAKHSEDPNPTYLGEPVGWWDEDTLVVDTIGFNERTWLDQDGHPHSPQLHTIERFTRIDERTLHYEVTIDDPGAYAEAWTTAWRIPWSAGEELWEYVCQENNKDVDHLFGK